MINPNGPKLFVGAVATRLSPRVEQPKHNVSPIALEIKDGIGIGIDGESIVISPSVKGNVEIIGHMEDGLYPQRDFNVIGDGNKAVVDGYFDWQDQVMEKKGNKVSIKADDPRNSYEVESGDNGMKVSGHYPVQNYQITFKENQAKVDGYEDGGLFDYQIATKGNVTTIKNEYEENSFTVTREKNKMKVDGKMAYQDFEITWTDKQINVKGLWPQQNVTIKFKS